MDKILQENLDNINEYSIIEIFETMIILLFLLNDKYDPIKESNRFFFSFRQKFKN